MAKRSFKLPTRSATDIQADVLIVGGGLVGGSLACALAGSGLKIAVLDHVDQRAQIVAEFDGRASAIAQGPKKMLDQIGVWGHLGDEATPIKRAFSAGFESSFIACSRYSIFVTSVYGKRSL